LRLFIGKMRPPSLFDLVPRALGALALLCLLVGQPAFALDPDRAIGQLTHAWYRNQLAQGTVLSIAQRSDGSLWLATYGGLVHHSGAGFTTYDQRLAPALKSSAVTAVHVDRDDRLWVGTLNGGLYLHTGISLEPVSLPAEIESVFGIVQDRAGVIWLTTNAGVARMERSQAIRLLGEAEGFPPRGFYRAIVTDPDGGIWIAADGVGVLQWQEGEATLHDAGNGLPTNAVYSLAVDRNGTVWAGTQSGPARFEQGRFQRDSRLAELDEARIYSLYGDSDGNLWLAPLGLGICRLTAQRFDCDNGLDGLLGETVRSMFEDQEGNLWMGTTSSGIHRFSNSKLVTVTGRMDSNAVRAVYQDEAGTLWVGTDGAGLARYQNQVLVPASDINASLPSQLLRAILTDAEGSLWVGGTEGVSRIAADGTVRNFGIEDGMPGTIVFAFAHARDGGLWVGTLQGVARIEGEHVEILPGTQGDDTRALYEDAQGRLWIGLRSGLRCSQHGVVDRCGTDGLPGTSVFAFHQSENGDLWLGTSIGLMRLRDGQVEAFTQRAGLHGDAVFAILDDQAGHFWISSNRGIARFAKADLLALENGEREQVEPTWFGQHDGMLNSQANGASQTPAWRTRDGRLWFGTAHGVVMVDPERQLRNTRIPPVSVERVLVDGEAVSLEGDIVLAPGIERIELHYAAASYVAPAAVRYRYRIEGLNRDWIDAGDRRVAHYTTLPPGQYSFQVIASNNDGVWNTEGASLRFQVLPSWHQSGWFRSLFALACLGMVAAAWRARVWQLRQRERDLSREVAQRTEELREANERLYQLARLDGLTRIANRGAFDQRLQACWNELAVAGEPLAVLLCDIDDFKAYNDSYGHLAGDAALTSVAGVLSQSLRSGADLAARYGGEEFAVLLPRCGLREARDVADRLLKHVRDLGIEHRASSVGEGISISIGVASTRPNAEDSPDHLLQQADQALYRAKAKGRNQVVEAL